MPAVKKYEGDVCYVGQDHESSDGRQLRGGFHYTVIEGPDGEHLPGEPLVLEEDGTYRPAKDDDTSHHDAHHKQFAAIVQNFSEEELQQMRDILAAQGDGPNE